MGSHWKAGKGEAIKECTGHAENDVLEAVTVELLLRELRPKSGRIRRFRKIIGAGIGVTLPHAPRHCKAAVTPLPGSKSENRQSQSWGQGLVMNTGKQSPGWLSLCPWESGLIPTLFSKNSSWGFVIRPKTKSARFMDCWELADSN